MALTILGLALAALSLNINQLALLTTTGVDRNLARLDLLCLGDLQVQDAVLKRCTNLIGVDLRR